MSELATTLWRNYWHLVCHRAELPQPGDFIKLKVLSHEVVIFNDAGDLVAFDNRCPHRGARMYLNDSGNQAATCAYHGWTHSHGRMIIPNPQQFSACAIEKARLNTWRTEWIGDFLFVGDQPQLTIEDQLADIRPILEDISFGVTGRVDMDSYTYECSWQIALENALEPYHIDLVHPTSLGMLDLEPGENVFTGKNSIWSAPVGSKRVNKQLQALNRFFSLDHQFAGYQSLYVFPFAMLSSTYGFSHSLQNFFPSEEKDRAHFTSRLLKMAMKPDVDAALLDAFFDSTAKVNRQVFQEDHAICRRVPQDTWTSEPPAFAADSEAKLLHFRQSCREVAAGQF